MLDMLSLNLALNLGLWISLYMSKSKGAHDTEKKRDYGIERDKMCM